MPRPWQAANMTMEWRWGDPHELIANGKPTRKRFEASQFVIDWEHQQATCPPSDTPASVGLRPLTTRRTRSSRSASLLRIAKSALVRSIVPILNREFLVV